MEKLARCRAKVLLTRVWLYQGPQCLSSMGDNKAFPGEAQRDDKALPWQVFDTVLMQTFTASGSYHLVALFSGVIPEPLGGGLLYSCPI